MKSIELLVSALSDSHSSEIIIQSYENTTFDVLLNLKRADGKVIPYYLRISSTQENKIIVSETVVHLLPKCCPDRHINFDGTFCLYWDDDIDLRITSIDKATLWWQILINFLLKQERAKKKREWPNQEDAWAHGRAAVFQKSALSALDKIGVNYRAFILSNSIQVTYHKTNRGNGSYYKVLKNGARWYIVWEKFQRVAMLRQKCLCGSKSEKSYKTTLRNCCDRLHQKYFVHFAINYYRWKMEEEKFWECFKGQACCNTLDSCPLKDY